MFRIQVASKFGTETPAVARTLFQGSKIFGCISMPDKDRLEANGILHELQGHVLRCVEVRDTIAKDADTARYVAPATLETLRAGIGVVTMPGVPDIQARAESFLQSAKLAISDTARLVRPFYAVTHDYRYDRFAKWAEEQFGEKDRFAIALKTWEPWVERVTAMRNAVDHPKSGLRGRLVVENFSLIQGPNSPVLVEPTWCLSGEKAKPLVDHMSDLIEGILALGEMVVVELFYKLKPAGPFAIHEIPLGERNPACPVRFFVGIAEDVG